MIKKRINIHSAICFLILGMIVTVFSQILDADVSLSTEMNSASTSGSTSTDTAVLQKDKLLLACIANKQLNDGVYIGESLEWTGMKVQVEVIQGEISKVDVLDVQGSEDYYDVVVKMLPKRMRRNKTYNVDGISGSTLSCESIKSAVKLALYQAIPEALSN